MAPSLSELLTVSAQHQEQHQQPHLLHLHLRNTGHFTLVSHYSCRFKTPTEKYYYIQTYGRSTLRDATCVKVLSRASTQLVIVTNLLFPKQQQSFLQTVTCCRNVFSTNRLDCHFKIRSLQITLKVIFLVLLIRQLRCASSKKAASRYDHKRNNTTKEEDCSCFYTFK